ncbi:hypothetical protein AB0N05_33705 [Nocardia sp. NPDC051030]|uniref:phthiocerol/phthiodiolone dimycocerosyl transferase family protein n=1 Tax=Nocardia sp. NPDC051030 TaxID=3155162 RepID=UPI0034437CF8
MSTQRLLSPFEIGYFSTDARLGSVPIGGMPLFIGSTVRGRIDARILRRVLAELAAGHVLLRSHVVTGDDGRQRFVANPGYQPVVEERAGGVDEYWALVNTPQDWDAGLFRAVLLHGSEHTRIVLVIHHGISDGRSAFALLEEMWQRYTAYITGYPLPLHDSDSDLIPGIDAQLARVTTEADIDGLLAQVRAMAANFGPEAAARTLPVDGDGVGDPGGRLAMRRIELGTYPTSGLLTAARAQGISVNSLLAGAALAAVRTEIEATGPIPLLCGHAVDLRPEITPELARTTLLNCAAGAGSPALVDTDADPLALGTALDADLRHTLEARFPAVFMLAVQRELDAEIAAILSAPPTIALSNMGRLPAHPTPAGVTIVRDDVFATNPGMPPKMTIFTVGDRLIIQVEYDTAAHSHAQMERVTQAMRDQLHRVSEAALHG